MPPRSASDGWRIFFRPKDKKDGNWSSPDTTTGSSSVYGRERLFRKVEKLDPFSNPGEGSRSLFPIYGVVSLPSPIWVLSIGQDTDWKGRGLLYKRLRPSPLRRDDRQAAYSDGRGLGRGDV